MMVETSGNKCRVGNIREQIILLHSVLFFSFKKRPYRDSRNLEPVEIVVVELRLRVALR